MRRGINIHKALPSTQRARFHSDQRERRIRTELSERAHQLGLSFVRPPPGFCRCQRAYGRVARRRAVGASVTQAPVTVAMSIAVAIAVGVGADVAAVLLEPAVPPPPPLPEPTVNVNDFAAVPSLLVKPPFTTVEPVEVFSMMRLPPCHPSPYESLRCAVCAPSERQSVLV